MISLTTCGREILAGFILILLIAGFVLDHGHRRPADKVAASWWISAIGLAVLVLFAVIGSRYAQAAPWIDPICWHKHWFYGHDQPWCPMGLRRQPKAKAWRTHDHEHPELDGWYHDLHAQNGAWCCEGNEATHLADTDWESKDGHYRVRIDGRWIDVPDGAVIAAPNRDGRTLVWPFYLNGERAGVRCFMPGSMT
ncbi:MAG TPA: hypothetical protein VEU47_10990 [Candidatus Cybelea sp.]|nr:hypothetical protein [Candidatus Cybelea sp.]